MKFKPPEKPWEIPALTDSELAALKALNAGVASADQQRLALAVIVHKFSVKDDMSFRPGGPEGDRATAFAEGKRYVGTRIAEAIFRPMKPSAGAADAAAGQSEREQTRRNPKPETARGKPAADTSG